MGVGNGNGAITSADFLALAEQGDAETLYASMKARALSSLYFFSKMVLGYKDLAALHIDFCNEIQNSVSQRKRGFLMPRGHFKSTIVSKSYPLWRLCQDQEQRILIVGESDLVASKNLNDIKWNIINNQVLRWLFPEIIPPDINKTKWTDTAILLPRAGTYDESSIMTVGVGGKTTGFHFDLIIYDDMVGEKAAKSAAEMNAAIEWFQYAPGLLNDPANGEEILIGTRWKHGNEDLYGFIMEGLQMGETESGRKTGFSWYIRAALEDESGNPDVENGTPIFPERFTREVLLDILEREKEYKFGCQYQNDPSAPGATDFEAGWVKYYTIDTDRQTLIPTDGSAPVKLSQLWRLSFFDPSGGGASAKCQNGIAVLGGDSLRRIFVLDPWGTNCSYGDAIEKWHCLNDRYQCHENWWENVGAQKAVEDIVKERCFNAGPCHYCGKTHKRLNPKPFHPPSGGSEMNKYERIRFYAQPPLQEGRVYIPQGARGGPLKNQIINCPHSKMIDLLDSMASGIHLLKFPPSEEAVTIRREADEKAKQVRQQRTHTTYNYGGYV
jgi:hypothetical protein